MGPCVSVQPADKPIWLPPQAGIGQEAIRPTAYASTWFGFPSTAAAFWKGRRVLEEAVAMRLAELLRQACEVKAWGLVEMNVQPDHVHLLLQVTPCDCIADVVQLLKGGTARILRLEFPQLEEFLSEEFLWGDSFWADGYFAETVDQQEEARVRDYIRNQRSPETGHQQAHYKRKRHP